MNGIQVEEKNRTKFLKVLVVFICAAYSLYLFRLQVIQGEEYTAQARKYAVQSVKIPAFRGEIFDRNRTTPFATNEEAFSVGIVPAEISNSERDLVFARVANLLDIKIDEIRKRVPPKYYHLYQQISITSSAGYSTITKLAEHKEDFPWRVLEFQADAPLYGCRLACPCSGLCG